MARFFCPQDSEEEPHTDTLFTVERETQGRQDIVEETPRGPIKAKDDIEELRMQLGAITDQLQGFTFAFQEQ